MSGTLPADGRRVVAVLGAGGSVGTHVTSAFERAGYRVLAIGRNPVPAAEGRECVRLDVAAATPSEIAGILDRSGAGLVVNSTGGWLSSWEDNEYAHVRLVERLLEAGALLPEPPRLVQIGTIHEYGPVSHGTLIDESRACVPETAYGVTKLRGSRAVLRATEQGTVRGTVLRAVNVFGPGVAAGSFLGTVVRKLRVLPAGERLTLEVGGGQRDFVDVRDLADAVLRAAEAEADSVVGRTVNIGRGEALSMRDMLPLLVEAAGLPPEVLRLEDGPVSSKGGDWTRADASLAGQLLGWKPATGLHRSLWDMWSASGS